MDKKIALLPIILYLISGVFFTPPAYAVTTPSFPVCTNPQGSVKVSYSNGIHGIVGDTNEYKGSDTVYTLSDTTLMQCFCAENGTGIQTNWLKLSNYSERDIEILKSEGWYYIPNGLLWGLEQSPYGAKNNNYSCKSTTQVGGSSDSRSDSQNVLGAVTNILGLANTGDSGIIYGLCGAGLASLLLGLMLKNPSEKSYGRRR